MPIYEYRCENGHSFEVMQRMSDPPVAACQVCGAAVHRVFHPVAVHFKGSGFYNTDYGTRKRQRETAAEGSTPADGAAKSDSGSADAGTSTDKKDAKDGASSPAKPASKAESTKS
jgi:putative FmdB family regulatory protein